MRTTCVTLIVVIFAVSSYDGLSQWSSDPKVNTLVSTMPDDPRAVSDHENGAIICWGAQPITGLFKIVLQRIDASGALRWGEGVNPAASPTSSQDLWNSDINSDGVTGGVFVAWSDAVTHKVYCQFCNGNGQRMWGADGVSVSSLDQVQERPKVIGDGSGGAIVCWESHSAKDNIYLQRIGAGGNTLWTSAGILVGTAEMGQPWFTSDGEGGAIVAWVEGGADRAQRISSNGTALWGDGGVVVSSTPLFTSTGALLGVVTDGAGGAFICWCIPTPGYPPEFPEEIIDVQRLGPDGQPMWSEGPIFFGTANADIKTPISDGLGNVFFSWFAENPPHQPLEVNFKLFPSGKTEHLDFLYTYYHDGSTFVSDGSGGIVNAFRNIRYGQPTGDGPKLYAQRIGNQGANSWYTVINDDPSYAKGPPSVVAMKSGAAIVTWADFRPQRPGIYAQLVCPDGSLGCPPSLASLRGTVTTEATGMEGVTVDLLDGLGHSLGTRVTDPNGEYSFTDLSADSYTVMIVEPLGYSTEENPKAISLGSGETKTVDYSLIPSVLSNSARGKGYWKHQFDVYVSGTGTAQESVEALNGYIAAVHEHYTPHFSIFDGKSSIADWQTILSASGKSTTAERASGEVAVLLLNLVSLKLAQYTVVSADDRTAGDVLTYVSELLTDGDQLNDETAKNLAEMVNSQEVIGAGLVPQGATLYKGGDSGGTKNISWRFDVPTAYGLVQNFPNPFNPSTTIRYAVPHRSHVTLSIFNRLGQQVATLVNRDIDAGYYDAKFDASGLASGIYFYRLQTGDFVQTHKLLLLK